MTPDRDGPNPYAPPARDAEDLGVRPVEAVGALFSPMQIGVATVLGSVFGGSLLLQANYRAVREVLAANVVLILGVVATLGIYLFFYALHQPSVAFTLSVNLVAVVTTCWLASSLQRDRYENHVFAGGRHGSNWWVLGAILVSAAGRSLMVAAIKWVIRRLARHA